MPATRLSAGLDANRARRHITHSLSISQPADDKIRKYPCSKLGHWTMIHTSAIRMLGGGQTICIETVSYLDDGGGGGARSGRSETGATSFWTTYFAVRNVID